MIRRCHPADLRSLEWGGEFTHDRDVIEHAFARTRDGSMVMLVAQHRRALVGQIWIDLARSSGTAYLWALRVRSPWRRRGIGTRLLLRAERIGARRGATAAELDVDVDNESARRLYHRLGYQPVTASALRKAITAGRWS